jgi:hypothetical protein
MRPALKWTLGATSLLAAAALALDDKPARVVAAVDRATERPGREPQPRRDMDREALPPLPSQLEPQQIEPARRDIFAPVEPPAPPVKVAAPVPAPPPPPAPAPTAPPITWRYLGAMVTPAEERLVMLARGDTSITVQVGTRLDEGYVVESISTDAVRLAYPPLGTSVDIPIPPAPAATR